MDLIQKGKGNDHTLKYLLWGFGLFFLVNGIETANYLLKEGFVPIEEENKWTTNILKQCDVNMDFAFDAKTEIQNSMVNLGFGSFFGLIYFGKHNSKYCYANVEGLACWKALLRFAIALVPLIILMLPFLLIPVGSMNIYLCSFLKSMLPTFSCGFFIFSGAFEWMFSKMGLLNIKEKPQ